MKNLRRKEYWADLMDQAYEFMSAIRDYPVQECGEAMVSLTKAVKDGEVDIHGGLFFSEDRNEYFDFTTEIKEAKYDYSFK